MPHDRGGPSEPGTRSAAAGTLVTVGALLLLLGWFRDEIAGNSGLSPVAGRWLGAVVVLLCALVALVRIAAVPGFVVRWWVTNVRCGPPWACCRQRGRSCARR